MDHTHNAEKVRFDCFRCGLRFEVPATERDAAVAFAVDHEATHSDGKECHEN